MILLSNCKIENEYFYDNSVSQIKNANAIYIYTHTRARMRTRACV